MTDSAQQLADATALQDLGSVLKAAGDPLRLEILRVLARGSYGVLELSSIFAMRQNAMSHHLKVLATADLVATRREGNSIFYRRIQLAIDDPHYELLSVLFKTLDDIALHQEIQQNLVAIERERADASVAFFAANAHKFREQQDLIASYPIYAEHVRDMLENVTLTKHTTVLEVGPGEGEFLDVLSKQFTQVIALDNSQEMLSRARVFAQEKNLTNIEFILGDTRTAVSNSLQADCIVINMVLHHVSSPADIFQDIGKILTLGGTLIITDLCRHDQQWARESCGDLWLGFDPHDFTEWAKAANLTEGQSQFFALRNGFQIQIREFTR